MVVILCIAVDSSSSSSSSLLVGTWMGLSSFIEVAEEVQVVVCLHDEKIRG